MFGIQWAVVSEAVASSHKRIEKKKFGDLILWLAEREKDMTKARIWLTIGRELISFFSFSFEPPIISNLFFCYSFMGSDHQHLQSHNEIIHRDSIRTFPFVASSYNLWIARAVSIFLSLGFLMSWDSESSFFFITKWGSNRKIKKIPKNPKTKKSKTKRQK